MLNHYSAFNCTEGSFNFFSDVLNSINAIKVFQLEVLQGEMIPGESGLAYITIVDIKCIMIHHFAVCYARQLQVLDSDQEILLPTDIST